MFHLKGHKDSSVEALSSRHLKSAFFSLADLIDMPLQDLEGLGKVGWHWK
jgi:hypothetical protein